MLVDPAPGERSTHQSASGPVPFARHRLAAIAAIAAMAAGALAGCGAGPPAERQGALIYSSDRAGSFDLYTDDLDGESQALLLGGAPPLDAEGDEYSPVVSPDGARISFVSTRDNAGDASIANELYVADADGGNPERLTSDRLADATPTWSPDGGAIVFSRGREGRLQLWSYDLTRQRLRPLTEGGPERLHPSFSPDGRRLAFAQGTGARTSVWTSEPDGSKAVRLTPPGIYDMDPEFSPDGAWIAVSRLVQAAPDSLEGVESARGDRDIVLVSADGDAPARRLTRGPDDDREPAFSPDGRSLAFVRRSASGVRARIMIVPTAGGGQRPLTDGSALALGPDWWP